MERFVNFMMFICMMVTAASTFAIAVELIHGWGNVGPTLAQAWAEDGVVAAEQLDLLTTWQ
jgi:NAD/NADP transhydrogenase alpha subunit